MWLLDRVSAKIKLIYQQYFHKEEQDVYNSFPNTFFTINDLKLRYKNDSIDIDHLIIGPSGIYCIQDINYPGTLTGDENCWEHQTDKKTYHIKEPYELAEKYNDIIHYIIRQNEKFLFSDPLKSDEIPVFPIIINAASSGRMSITRGRIPVIKSFDLKRIININSNEEFLTTNECMKLGKLLISKNTNRKVVDNELDYR